MKKSIIALAALAAMTAQADETTIYGSVRAEYAYQDGQSGDNISGRETNRSSSTIGDAGSRFGIKGEESLGNGVSAFYLYENRLDGEIDGKVSGKENKGSSFAKTNKLYVGLKSDTLGSLSVGRQNLPVDSLGNYSDPFNSLTPGSRADEVVKTSANNSMVYWTPNMNGFSAGIGGVADGYDGRDHNHVDYISAAAKYEANGFFAGVGYSQDNDDVENDAYTVGLGYGNDKFEMGMLADYSDEAEMAWVRASALYNVTPMDSVYAGYSSIVDLDDVDFGEGWNAAVGYQHKFSKRSRMWAEYGFQDESDINKVSVGLRTDF